MARSRIVDFSGGVGRNGATPRTDGGGGAPSQLFIPWDQAGAQASPTLANHSGQAQAAVDPELLELAAMEAAEHLAAHDLSPEYTSGTYNQALTGNYYNYRPDISLSDSRPMSHGKAWGRGHAVAPVRGQLVPGAQNGVGQPSLDGFEHARFFGSLLLLMQERTFGMANRKIQTLTVHL